MRQKHKLARWPSSEFHWQSYSGSPLKSLMHQTRIPQHHGLPEPQTCLAQLQMVSLLTVLVFQQTERHNRDEHSDQYEPLSRLMAIHINQLRPVLDEEAH